MMYMLESLFLNNYEKILLFTLFLFIYASLCNGGCLSKGPCEKKKKNLRLFLTYSEDVILHTLYQCMITASTGPNTFMPRNVIFI